jgi:peptidoglycan hydrolase-like protein with peptidoglycan-binding domain
MKIAHRAAAVAALSLTAALAGADDIVHSIETSLRALGYAVDAPDGELDAKTEIAISKFQLANNLEATGAPSVKLAALLEIKAESAGAAASAAPPAKAQPDCVPRSANQTVASTQRVTGGVSKLFGAAANIGSRFGGGAEAAKVGGDIATVAGSTSTAVSGANEVGAIPDRECP